MGRFSNCIPVSIKKSSNQATKQTKKKTTNITNIHFKKKESNMKTQTSVFACVLAMAAVAEALSPRATDAYRQGNGVVEPADTGSSSGSGAVSSGSDGEYSGYWEGQDSIYKEAVNKKSDTKCDNDCKNGVDQWVLTQRLDAVDEAAAAAKAKQGCDEPCKKKVDEWARKQKELVTQLDKEMKDRFAAIDAEAAKRKAAPECDDACKNKLTC